MTKLEQSKSMLFMALLSVTAIFSIFITLNGINRTKPKEASANVRQYSIESDGGSISRSIDSLDTNIQGGPCYVLPWKVGGDLTNKCLSDRIVPDYAYLVLNSDPHIPADEINFRRPFFDLAWKEVLESTGAMIWENKNELIGWSVWAHVGSWANFSGNGAHLHVDVFSGGPVELTVWPGEFGQPYLPCDKVVCEQALLGFSIKSANRYRLELSDLQPGGAKIYYSPFNEKGVFDFRRVGLQEASTLEGYFMVAAGN